MLQKIVGIADLFVPKNIANDPNLAREARRFKAVSRMQLIILSNMFIFNIPLLVFGGPGRPLPLLVAGIAVCVFLGLISMYYLQTFVIPLLIALVGSISFMFYGMLITGGMSSPFVFMLMALPIVTITFGNTIVYKILYSLIGSSYLTIIILQYSGWLPTSQVAPFTALEQTMSILAIFSITIIGGMHTRTEIKSVRNALRTAKEKAVLEARIDSLTKLSNSRAFMENGIQLIEKMERCHLNQKETAGQQLFLLMVDVDYFKNVNDTYGHSIGDLVLMEVAKSLNKTTRSFEIVARLGGEEFGILLESDGKQGALIVAERLRVNVENLRVKLNEQAEQFVTVTISIGISLWRPGYDLNTLMKNADLGLYAAKKAGRNRVVYQTD